VVSLQVCYSTISKSDTAMRTNCENIRPASGCSRIQGHCRTHLTSGTSRSEAARFGLL